VPVARPEELPARVGRIATIARFKPVHRGHAAVLEALVDRADRVTVGIGSSNRHDGRNPFTAAESAEMIRLVVGDRVELLEVPDLDDGPRWRAMVVGMLGELDLFVTANAYVRDLLIDDYTIAHPVWLVPPDRRVRVNGTMVRRAMARGEDWRALVPRSVAEWIETHRVIDRFLRELRDGTLTLDGEGPL